MKDKVLNLKASQAIASLGIECGSEKWHAEYRHAHNQPKWKWVITDDLYEGDYWYYRNEISAPNLQELLALLPDIGEKLEWDNAGCVDKIYCNAPPTMSMLEWKAHKLLDTYLSHGMEGCSKEIIRLIKEQYV